MTNQNTAQVKSTGSKSTLEPYQKNIVSLLWISIFIMWAVMMSIFPTTPILSLELKRDAGWIGDILGLSSLIMTLLSLPAGVLSDRFGRKPLVVAGLAISTIGLGLTTFISDIPFISGWLLFGIGRGLFLTPAFTIPADIFPPQHRGKVIGYLTSSMGLGAVLGYVGGSVLVNYTNIKYLLLLDSAIVAFVTILVLFLPESLIEKRKSSLSQAFSDTFFWLKHKKLLILSFTAGLSFVVGVAATFLVPYQMKEIDMSMLTLAVLFIPYELMTSVGTIVIGKLAVKIGRQKAIILTLFSVAIALALFIFIPVSAWSITLIYTFVGLTEGPIISLTTSSVTEFAISTDPRRIGVALGAYRLIQGLGPCLGPLLGGWLVLHLSGTTQFLFLSILVLVIMFISLMNKEKQRARLSNYEMGEECSEI